MTLRPAKLFFITLLIAVPIITIAAPAAIPPPFDINFSNNKEVQSFINDISQKDGFKPDMLKNLFTQAKYKQKIIDAITRPAESKPWYEYRPIFLNKKRINEGVAFWNKNQQVLEQAEKEYGVPPEIIVAILGVETRYGKHKGTYRVMDALSTLAFGFPQRADFFRSELEQYLLLTREEKLDPLAVKGSYAGAMGNAQFISSSYRSYAVDFDGDGKRDLWNNISDTIGSVANYFKRHQWQRGGMITVPVTVGGDQIEEIVDKGLKPHSTVAELLNSGITPKSSLNPDEMGALIELEDQTGKEYWLGFNNFYVITRYNHSPLYAMAVYQLGQAILDKRESVNKMVSKHG